MKTKNPMLSQAPLNAHPSETDRVSTKKIKMCMMEITTFSSRYRCGPEGHFQVSVKLEITTVFSRLAFRNRVLMVVNRQNLATLGDPAAAPPAAAPVAAPAVLRESGEHEGRYG